MASCCRFFEVRQGGSIWVSHSLGQTISRSPSWLVGKRFLPSASLITPRMLSPARWKPCARENSIYEHIEVDRPFDLDDMIDHSTQFDPITGIIEPFAVGTRDL